MSHHNQYRITNKQYYYSNKGVNISYSEQTLWNSGDITIGMVLLLVPVKWVQVEVLWINSPVQCAFKHGNNNVEKHH